MDHAGHTVKNSARQGGGFWKEIDGEDFGMELARRRILSTFTKCGPWPTVTLAAAKHMSIFKEIHSKTVGSTCNMLRIYVLDNIMIDDVTNESSVRCRRHLGSRESSLLTVC